MKVIDQEEIAGHAAKWLALVEAGEPVLIKRGDRVIAKIVPVSTDGTQEVAEDNVAPSDEVEQAFYGD